MTASPLPPAQPRLASRAQSAALYAACWLPLVVIYIGVLTWMTDGTLAVTVITLAALLNTIGPAVFGVGIWWLTGRVPIPSPPSTRFVAVHVAGAFSFVGAWLGWELLILGPFGSAASPDAVMWRYVLPWQGVLGFMLYGVVAAVSYAIRGVFLAHALAVSTAESDHLRADAELAALRAHLNPHFLFNTLHGVMQLLRDDPALAERALERLAELLRYVLRLDRAHVRLVTLEAEWQFVQSYLWLEQLRIGDRLRVDAEMDEEALDCEVPPFTLQPLVENALRHGIAPKLDGGTVRIRARNDGDRLSIEVADDGVGAARVPTGATPGLGLPAVLRRVRGEFGEANVSSDVSTAPDAGFRITIVMPARAAALSPETSD
ncbi:MAG: sensor histidine kinase [Gemmatimonadaceae bacterium]